MKMVKSLLLGSAAGLVAVAGAQAADLPVKAKPVEYVKICTLYGEGFYYIPGSDTCIKLGGYVRADYGWNVSGRPYAGLYRHAGCAGSYRIAVLDPASRQRADRHPHADRVRHAAHVHEPALPERRQHVHEQTLRAPSSSGRASRSAMRSRSRTPGVSLTAGTSPSSRTTATPAPTASIRSLTPGNSATA